MNIINLTPHKINIISNSGSIVEIEPSGTIARVQQTITPWDDGILVDGTDQFITISKSDFGEVENLPEPEEGTLFVVSSIVKNAVPERIDVLRPGKAVRNEDGQIVGCEGLSL